jgi:excisionase family DNA binding protein
MDTESGGELITVQAAADWLAVSRWMVYQLIWDHRVKSVQIGRCRRIVRQSFGDCDDGRYELKVFVDTPDGRRKRISVYGSTWEAGHREPREATTRENRAAYRVLQSAINLRALADDKEM